MKSFLSFGLILIIFIITLPAQSVVVKADPAITQILEQHTALSQKIQKTTGFRVQIYSTSGQNSLNAVNTIKSKFNTAYPKIEAYISFVEPNFKVRVGNFRTRMEARGFLNEIKAQYPDSFVVKDEIYFPDL